MNTKVEQAAKTHIGFPHDPTVAISAYEKGFVNGSIFGAAWMKEQGIQWISVDENPPIIKEEFATPLLITDGKTFKVWYLIYDNLLNTGSFKTTHWAYINLPKTDK